MKNPHDIILRPVLTEKSYDGMADKRYVFEVAINANKIKRQGRYAGRTPEIKKAYVTLKEDSKTIEFFDGMAQ